MNVKHLFAALVLVISPWSAVAQDPSNVGYGSVSAIAYGELAPGTPFDTLAAEDTDLDANALQRVNQELSERGYGISRDATLVMIVDMTLVRAEGQDDRIEVPRSGTDAPLGKGDNLYSTERSTILNYREAPRSGHLLRLDISVYDRKTGLYLWRGQISRDGLDVKVEQAEERMVPVLLEHLGRTQQAEDVPLQ